MRYLALTIVTTFLLATIGVALAAPKTGEVHETIYACTSLEVLEAVITRETAEDLDYAAQLGVDTGACLYKPEGVQTKLGALKKTFESKLTGRFIYIFEFVEEMDPTQTLRYTFVQGAPVGQGV